MTNAAGENRNIAISLAMLAIEKQFGRGSINPSTGKDKINGAVTKIDVANYKSIKRGSIKFTGLTILVGMNGTGKSNMLDALAFLSDSLLFGCNFAINSRGGMQSLVRNTQRSGSYFSMKLHFLLKNGVKYTYKIKIKKPKYKEFEISEEILTANSKVLFKVLSGNVELYLDSSIKKISSDSLMLTFISGREESKGIYDFISNIRLYSPNVEAIRTFTLPDTSQTLTKGAENIANIVDKADRYSDKQKVRKYLVSINPVIDNFVKRKFGKLQAVNFTVRNNRYYLYPDSMSDGTLRAFALLIAIFQDEWPNVPKLSLICIEEPETGLHPAAAATMMEAINEASKNCQIIITTHSADILETVDPDKTNIIYTSLSKDNSTVFSTISPETISIIRQGLYNPGELLKMGQLN